MRLANTATIGAGAVLVAVIMVCNYYNVKEMAELSQQIDQRLFGEGIYEYHAMTGKWPSKMDDLTKTSLPLRYPLWWKDHLVLQANVIVTPKDLKPDPKENGHIIICYHNKGPDAERGRMWVCWGDLRSECITLKELQEQLNRQQERCRRQDRSIPHHIGG